MAFPISSWAIRRPLVPIVIFFGLVLIGLLSFMRLPVNGMPNVNIPVVDVSVYLPGASPSEIESQVTIRVESAISGIGGIKHITSTVSDNVSSTKIEFQLGTDINQVLSKVRDQMIGIRPLLPKGTEEPIIQSIDADIVPILTFAATSSTRTPQALTVLVDNQITQAMLAIKGVAKVQRQGGDSREVRVMLDPHKLRAFGITAAMVNDQLLENLQNLPAGRIDAKTNQTLVRVLGMPTSLNQLREISIGLPSHGYVRLGDLGEIQDTHAPYQQVARVNGVPVVGFAIYRAKVASEVDLEKQINEVIKKLQSDNPDLHFTKVQTQVEFTKNTFHAALFSFIEGALLAAAVVYLFFRNWRATWITAIGIPLSVIPTFLFMKWLGFSLNMVSLLALSLVSGVLVDDAIVEIENIMRHLRMGKSPYRAAMDAADEIGLAVVATTIVIVAVFVPVSFMSGVVGQYFEQFGLTVAIATLFSLIVARFITPVLAAYFLKPFDENRAPSDWIDQYQLFLKRVLSEPARVILLALIVVISTLVVSYFLPKDFLPYEDKSQSTIRVELSPGTRIEETDRILKDLTQRILKEPEVVSVYTLAGAPDVDTNTEGEVRVANVQIMLKNPSQRSISAREFENKLMSKLTDIPNARIAILNENGSKALTFTLVSNDVNALESTAKKLLSQMRNLSHFKDVSSSIPVEHNEFMINPRSADVAKFGVTIDAISETERVALLGEPNYNLARINIEGRQTPIRVELLPGAKQDISTISELQIPNNEGVLLPISSVADIGFTSGPATISRYDRQRQITLEANLNQISLGEGLNKIEKLPANIEKPSNVKRFDTGDAELLDEMFDSFLMALATGAVIVLAVLVLLFRKLFQPITIMVALPLSLFGACVALWMTGSALSLPSVIGILMLTGIVGKNGILLVDFIIEAIDAGKSREEAILQAASQRARPIVMTSMAMIAGMLPLVMGFGAGNAFRAPMAVAVIGGLVTSTMLSLLFVPVVFVMMDNFEQWVVSKLKNKIGLNAKEL
jgi:hydrophobe/amphiphile efflux-1 (HAE1) family protein